MPILSDLEFGLTNFWLKLVISNKGRIAHRAGQVRQFLRQLTRNLNRWPRVLLPATRVRPKPSFDRAVSGEDDRVPGSISGPTGSWTALLTTTGVNFHREDNQSLSE